MDMKSLLAGTALGVVLVLAYSQMDKGNMGSGDKMTDAHGTTQTTESVGGDKKDKKDLPLEMERDIRFETDEATWLSIDVHPNGQSLIFDMLGDLYTLPISGGEATAMMTGPAFDGQPKYSPDGSMIAFVSDRDGSENLWISKADGSDAKKLTKLTSGEAVSPTWSPDGQYVVVAQLGKGLGVYELWMYHKDGGSGVQITNGKPMGDSTPRNQQVNAMGPSFSPDGRYIYYATKRGGFSYNAQYPMWRVARYDTVEGRTDTIATAQGSTVRPIISPDGTTMVYGTRYETETGLRIRNLDTGEDKWLAYPIQRDDQESRATRDLLPNYTFTPDGKSVLVTADGKIVSIDVASGNRTIIPFNAKVDMKIGPNLVHQEKDPEGPVVARIIQTPDMAPDGSAIIFSALGELYRMTLEEGASPMKLGNTQEHAFMPSYSGDGRWVTYVTWAEDGGHIWKTRADGSGQPMQITRTKGYYTQPAFAPGDDSIVAIRASQYEYLQSGQETQADLIKLSARGGDATVIYPGSNISAPHFSKENDRVYLHSGAGIISVRMDGSDKRSHIAMKGNGFYSATKPVPARDSRISPDGKWALGYASNQLYLAAVVQNGNKAQEVVVHRPPVPVKQISKIGADYFGWSEDGSEIFWAVGNHFFRQKLADISFEKPKPQKDDKDDAKEGDDADQEMDDTTAETADDKGTVETKPLHDETVAEYIAKVTVPRDIPNGSLLLRGATVITMSDQGTLENADILVVNNKIQAVGARGSLDVPAGTASRDMSGKFITPGFVDSHAHWRAWATNGVIDPYPWAFLSNLAYGVTAGLDVQTGTNHQFVYQDMFDAGKALGIRAWSTGPGVFSDNDFKTKEQTLHVLRRYRDFYRTKNIKAYVSGNRKQRQMVIQASKELGILPTTEGALDLKLDLTHTIDGFAGNEHSLPILPLRKDVIELTAQSKIGYTPTLLVSYGGPWAENYFYTRQSPHDDAKLNRFTPHSIVDQSTKRRPWFRAEEHVFPRIAKSAIAVQKAGGRIGVGSHGQLQGLGYHWEMWALAAGSDNPMQVLRAATIDGATIIGHGQEVGSIEAGKFADLVILDRNPLDDIKNTNSIAQVMRNGRLYDGNTLDQVYPEQKALPKLWFHDLAPKQ